jgi:hypothetical protein
VLVNTISNSWSWEERLKFKEKWWLRLELLLRNFCICIITFCYSYESILIIIRTLWSNFISINMMHANRIFICILCTYHTNAKMCIMHRKILSQVSYNTTDLIVRYFFADDGMLVSMKSPLNIQWYGQCKRNNRKKFTKRQLFYSSYT